MDWEKVPDRDKESLGYERDLKRWLDKLMVDLRAKIRRNEERLAQQEAIVLLAEDQVRQPFSHSQRRRAALSVTADQRLPWLPFHLEHGLKPAVEKTLPIMPAHQPLVLGLLPCCT